MQWSNNRTNRKPETKFARNVVVLYEKQCSLSVVLTCYLTLICILTPNKPHLHVSHHIPPSPHSNSAATFLQHPS